MHKFKKYSIGIMIILIVIILMLKSYDVFMSNNFKKSKLYSFMNDKINLHDDESIYYLEKGKGNKTVIFLSGSGVSSVYTDMYNIWNPISAHSKIFIYDRFGMGKSSLTKETRDIDTITDEFKTVLEKTNQKPPYIIIAHSMSSLLAIRFAQKYPKEVEGLVLIDGASPKFCNDFVDPMSKSVHILKNVRKIGLLRFLLSFDNIKQQFESKQDTSDEIKELKKELILKNLWNDTMINERKMLKKNAEIVSDDGDLKGIKLIIISAGNNGFDRWDKYQKELLELSDTSEQIFLNESSHFIHHDYPKTVIEEINKIIN